MLFLFVRQSYRMTKVEQMMERQIKIIELQQSTLNTLMKIRAKELDGAPC